jgi:hypothetical protein
MKNNQFLLLTLLRSTTYASRNTRFNQSKIINYAKRSQFFKKSSVYNRSYDNELQRKINNGHLVKTNPNEANLVRRNLGEGGFKWLAIKRGPIGRRGLVVFGGLVRRRPRGE